jgi:UDP-3-O-[3-hydroxymyristoyl] N-acetylglucosamine deacetylase
MTVLKVRGEQTERDEELMGKAISYQTTLRDSIRLAGKGLHSGESVTVDVHPAPSHTGIVFKNGSTDVPAKASSVVDTSRGTTVGSNGHRYRTVEHLLAALRGCGVDNAVIEMQGPEAPAMDGSAGPYAEAIESAGLVSLDSYRRCLGLDEPICVRNNGSFILAVPAEEMTVTYVMNYNHPMIGSQVFTYTLNELDFATEVAPARTFVLYEEVAALLESDLALGGSLENVIVVWKSYMSTALRYKDELVRHKVVDMVGDLSLAGGIIRADILAVKSGHTLNIELARLVERGQRVCV